MLLWLCIFLLLAVGISANYYYSDVNISLRLIAWLVLAIALGAIALQTQKGSAAWGFAREARSELRKVKWPKRQETLQVTMMVVLLVIVVALIIWGIDTIFLHLIGWLTGQRG